MHVQVLYGEQIKKKLKRNIEAPNLYDFLKVEL